MNHCSERIKDLIIKRGLSYGALAKRTGIPKSALQRYATGKTDKIPIDRIETIAAAVGATPEYIMGWENAQPSIRIAKEKGLIFPVVDLSGDAPGKTAGGQGVSNEKTAGDSFIGESLTNQGFSDENSADDSFTGESFTSQGSSNENSADESFTGDSLTGQNFSNENPADESFTGDSLIGNSLIGNSFTSQNFSNENFADGSFTGDSLTDQSSSNKISADGSPISHRFAGNRFTGESLEIPASVITGNARDYFVLAITDNAMHPQFIEGDRVLVRRGRLFKDGATSVVYINKTYVVRKISKKNENHVVMVPANPEYAPKHLTGEELNRAEVIGYICYLFRSLPS